MSKNGPRPPSKSDGKKAGVEVEVDPDGCLVFLSFRDLRTGQTATIKLHRAAAASLRALLAGSELDGDDTFAVVLRGDITIGEVK